LRTSSGSVATDELPLVKAPSWRRSLLDRGALRLNALPKMFDQSMHRPREAWSERPRKADQKSAAPLSIRTPAPALSLSNPGAAGFGLRARRQSTVKPTARLSELNPDHTGPACPSFGATERSVSESPSPPQVRNHSRISNHCNCPSVGHSHDMRASADVGPRQSGHDRTDPGDEFIDD
jgi:hypothetical protein